jgi:MFS family permease
MTARSRASAVMGLFRIGGNAVGLLLAKKFVQQPGPHVSQAMFTAGLLHLVIALSVVLLIALIITVVGVPERRKDDAPSTAAPDPWPARPSFAWLIASRTAVSMGLYLILPFLAFYLRFVQNAPNYLSRSLDLLLVMTVCALVGTVPAGIAGDRVPKKRILFGALALLAAGAVTLSFIPGTSNLLPLAVFLGVGWGAYFSVDWALACVLLPPKRAGALMAVWNIGASAPQVAAPIIGGLLVDRVGVWSGDLALGYRLLFALVALFVVLGAVGLGFVREPRAGLVRQTG